MAAHHHEGSPVLVASDACRRGRHRLADEEQREGSETYTICITCTEAWGNLNGLRTWEENCPCCFSAAYPNGLPDLGITALIRYVHLA